MPSFWINIGGGFFWNCACMGLKRMVGILTSPADRPTEFLGPEGHNHKGLLLYAVTKKFSPIIQIAKWSLQNSSVNVKIEKSARTIFVLCVWRMWNLIILSGSGPREKCGAGSETDLCLLYAVSLAAPTPHLQRWLLYCVYCICIQTWNSFSKAKWLFIRSMTKQFFLYNSKECHDKDFR
jgi:hypothetical protein